MSEFRSTHAPRTGITAQVIHDLGRGMTVRECADAHHLPDAFIAQIVALARARGGRAGGGRAPGGGGVF